MKPYGKKKSWGELDDFVKKSESAWNFGNGIKRKETRKRVFKTLKTRARRNNKIKI